VTKIEAVNLRIETEREKSVLNDETERGRWLADVPDLPGTTCYGANQAEAIAKVKTLALRVIADRLEHGEKIPAEARLEPCEDSWRVEARWILAELLRIGWRVKRESGGSHKVLARNGWPNQVFAFHDNDKIGPAAWSRIIKLLVQTPGDL
jgi:predicted RNase H-like HicB family nuclease/predicted RNA binding protein YcfA (HicA-like mRNA interferase family)